LGKISGGSVSYEVEGGVAVARKGVFPGTWIHLTSAGRL